MKLKFFGKAVAFLTIFAVLAQLVGIIVTPKWIGEDTEWEPATRMTEGFYDEPKNSIDVVFLGSSLIYRGISPITLWNDYGITGYDCGSSVQRMWISYYYLEEVLNYQSPKAVVLNMNGITDDTPNDEDRNRKALDYLRPSGTKLQAVAASMSGKEHFADYLFPLLRYHSRWENLTEDDFSYLSSDRHYFAKGQDLQFESTAYQPPKGWLNPTGQTAKAGKKAEAYFEKIVSLCKSKGISLLLIDMVSPARFSYETHNLNESLAKKFGLPYVDFNFCADAVGLDWNTDLRDQGVHLNVAGAEKFTRYLGSYLMGHYSLPDRRNSEMKKIWECDAAAYAQAKANYALSQETDFASYLQKLRNPDYLTFLSVSGYVSDSLPENQLLGLHALGLQSSLGGPRKNWSYLAVVDGGKAMLEEQANRPLLLHRTLDGLPIELESQGFRLGNSASIKIDRKELACKGPGVNLVVYDKSKGEFVDSVSFDLDGKAGTLRKNLKSD